MLSKIRQTRPNEESSSDEDSQEQVSWFAATMLKWAPILKLIVLILIGLVALAANVACLYLIARHRDGDVHMRASWIFSKNDVIANVGVVLSGGIVFVTGSRWPDLFVGIAIAYIVFRGALAIIEDARNEQRENMGEQIAE